MQREVVLERVRAMEPVLRQLGIAKLYLFGSIARQEPNAKDVDLLFEADPVGDTDLFKLGHAMDHLEERLERPVDLIDRKLLHERIRARVEAEMIEVF